MSSRRRKAGIVFCIVFALLLLIVVIAFFAVRSVFTDTSVRRTPVAEINPQDYRMAQLKTAGAVSRIRNASEHTPPQAQPAVQAVLRDIRLMRVLPAARFAPAVTNLSTDTASPARRDITTA